MTRVLALDVGGTNVRFSIARVKARSIVIEEQHRVPTKDYRRFEDAILAQQDWFTERGVERVSIACAGPVAKGVCKMSNLSWVVDARTLTKRLRLPTQVLNDFEAVGLGVRYVPADRLVTLQKGQPDARGPVAILGAGTGLGEALVLRTERGERVMPTEGGHATFAPVDDDDAGLIAFVRRKLGGGHVSVERVLSGQGLGNVFDWLVDSGRASPSDALRSALEGNDKAAVVGEAGTKGTDDAARMAVDRMVRIYGSEAGNLALKSIPTGGLYLAGGIAPKILPRLKKGFLGAFLDKGRMKPLLQKIPVHVITDGDVGLRGAAAA